VSAKDCEPSALVLQLQEDGSTKLGPVVLPERPAEPKCRECGSPAALEYCYGVESHHTFFTCMAHEVGEFWGRVTRLVGSKP